MHTQRHKLAKVFSNNYISETQIISQTGYISHFGPRQEPAIIIHGNNPLSEEGSGIGYYKGKTMDDKNHAGENIIPPVLSVKEFVAAVKKDFSLDLHRTGNTGVAPLHLICCYSGGTSPDSLGGQLSRELERSVVCYGDSKVVSAFSELKINMNKDARVYYSQRYNEDGFERPLHEIIHFPDNKPGQIRI